MPQPTKPTSMSLSEWRLWCCCYPTVTPPTSPLSQRETISLEEFDPGNRLSMSRAFEQQASTPFPPITPKKSNDSKPPFVAARRAEALPQPLRNERPKSKIENRTQQRPTTVLLPSPPQRPSGSQEPKVVKGEHSKPQIVRQDSEQWWQVGRRMLERKEKEEAPAKSSTERK